MAGTAAFKHAVLAPCAPDVQAKEVALSMLSFLVDAVLEDADGSDAFGGELDGALTCA
jgi:hypothetical protein